MKNKVKTVIFSILGIMLLYCLLLFIQNLIAKNEIKILSDDEYISIYKDDNVSYHMAPPISKGDFLNLNNRKLYKVISFNKYNVNFIFVKKIQQEKIEELLKMIEEYSNNNNNENKHYISPADIVGYYHVEYKDKNVKLEQLPFSF